MSYKVLITKDIRKSFGGTQALKGVDFELEKGEILGLIGENGAGKSTLIKIIAGYYSKDSGEIFVNGNYVNIQKPADSLALGIRVISQEFNLMNDMTVAENICIGDFPRFSGLFNHIVNRKKMNLMAKKMLDNLGEQINVTQNISCLSVAEQQIVEIAKALWKEPEILIMDEPTAALSDQETKHLFRLLKRLKDKGVSIIFITHRLQEQFELSDRVTVLRDGKFIGTVNIEDATPDLLAEMMVGKNICANYLKSESKPGEVIYEAKNLNINGKIKDINLIVHRGEIVSIFGLLGQGQGLLSRALIGDVKTDGGDIYIRGNKIVLNSPQTAIKNKIGFVSEDRKKAGLLLMQSTMRNISIASVNKISKYGIINPKRERALVKIWIEKLRIKCFNSNQIISSLSGGNQQKALIARWLANDSEIIILNLPTRGVDVGAKYDIYQILEDLCNKGIGVLIFSLELPEILGISDRIYVIRDGSLVQEFINDEHLDSEMIMTSAVGSIRKNSGGENESAK